MMARSAAGLAALGAGPMVLRAGAEATPASGDAGAYGDYLRASGESLEQPPTPRADPGASVPAEARVTRWSPTEDNILGPFYRPGAPFRGKVTPPLEPGRVLLITGRVWALDTRRPLRGAVLDLWQANHAGRYDNDDPRHPPAEGVFRNRCRLTTDEQGAYEVETIHPGAYRLTADRWRPPHVHYLVRAEGYRTLVTQLYFQGDPHQADDPFIKPSLIVPLNRHEREGTTYHTGVFDIVLAPA